MSKPGTPSGLGTPPGRSEAPRSHGYRLVAATDRLRGICEELAQLASARPDPTLALAHQAARLALALLGQVELPVLPGRCFDASEQPPPG